MKKNKNHHSMLYKIVKYVIFLIIVISIILSKEVFLKNSYSYPEDVSTPTNSKDKVLSLAQVIEIVLHSNLDIKIARLNSQIGYTKLPVALSAFDATVDVDFNYELDEAENSSSVFGSKSDTTNCNFEVSKKFLYGTTLEISIDNARNATNSVFSNINPSFVTTGSLSLTQALMKNYAGIQDRGSIELTKLDISNIDSESKDNIETIIADVSKKYWNLVFSVEALKRKKEALNKANELLKLNENRLKIGLVENPARLASLANVRLREDDVLIAENNVETAMNVLKLAINDRNFGKIIPAENISATIEQVDFDKSLEIALEQRRDFKRIKRDIKAKDIKLEMSSNERSPQVDLTATLDANGLDPHYEDSLGELFAVNNPTYFVGVTVSFPWKNRKAIGEYTKSKMEKSQLLFKLKQKENEIFYDIDEHIRMVELRKNNVAKRQEIENIEEDKLKEEEKRYKTGRSNINTIIDYQEDLLDAKLNTIKAIIEYKKALIDLHLEENTLLDKYTKLK